MSLVFITDPLVTNAGSVRPALLLSREFSKMGYNITIVSPSVSNYIASIINDNDVEIIDLGLEPKLIKHMPTLEYWLRLIVLSMLSINNIDLPLFKNSIVINTSSTIMANFMDIYYGQGPMTIAIRKMKPDMPWYYKIPCTILLPLLSRLEKRVIKKLKSKMRFFIVNSHTCKRFYEELGVKVHYVIYPPLDTELFKPLTSKPSADYVLTYFGTYGKETRYKVLKQIADKGIKIKAFGSKSHYIPRRILQHPNIEFLGYVGDDILIELYSNALYTLFPFNHEPFGYIPVESMACGTPVLTYNREGPSESVIHEVTGWLASNDEELIELAVRIWKTGYKSRMRIECRKRALEFNTGNIVNEWLKILKILEK